MVEILLGKLTRREFRQRMAEGTLQACILPLAATEQHLEHLAMEHDWRSVSFVARQVARRLEPTVLVAESVMVGVSEHHLNHRGTLTLRPGTFLSVVNDLIRSLVCAGFQHVLVLNGHGGNVQPCRSVWDQFVREFQVNLQFLSYWDVLTREDAGQLLTSGSRLPEDLPGHAQEFETSIALAQFAENVRSDVLPEQTDRTPSAASAAMGQEWLERIVERVSDHLRAMLAGERVVAVPPFHP